MNTYSNSFLARMQGDDLERAYAKVFGGRVIGGVGDGGLDITTEDSRVPVVQAKSSKAGLLAFLAESVKRGKFIPVCVGEPGAREEMISHLLKYGVWIGTDIPERQMLSTVVAYKVRPLCAA